MIKFIAVLYKYNSKNAYKEIPYFATFGNLLILLLLNVTTILCVFIPDRKSVDILENNSTNEKYIIGFLILIPVFLLFSLVVSKEKIKEEALRLTEKEYTNKGKILIIYFFLSVLLLLFVL